MNQLAPAVTRVKLSRVAELAARAIAGAAASAVGNIVIYAAADALALQLAVSDVPTSSASVPLSLRDVVIASVVPAVPAALVWAAIARSARDARRFSAIASAILILSMIPIALLPTGAATQLTLVLMHIVSAGTITTTLVWSRR